VALVDAAGVGTGLAIMSVPLALPLASLVFLGGFIPLVGAVISGFLAVVVALLSKGLVYALMTLGVLIGVNQLEAHILQPLVMGRAVSIHPLAVVLAISSGGVLGGIAGALLSVPTVAFLNNAFQVLLASEPSAAAVENGEAGPIMQAKPDDLETETSS
jgi:putative heme transporter